MPLFAVLLSGYLAIWLSGYLSLPQMRVRSHLLSCYRTATTSILRPNRTLAYRSIPYHLATYLPSTFYLLLSFRCWCAASTKVAPCVTSWRASPSSVPLLTRAGAAAAAEAAEEAAVAVAARGGRAAGAVDKTRTRIYTAEGGGFGPVINAASLLLLISLKSKIFIFSTEIPRKNYKFPTSHLPLHSCVCSAGEGLTASYEMAAQSAAACCLGLMRQLWS